MSIPFRLGWKRPAAITLAAASVLAFTSAAGAAPAQPSAPTALYIVQLAGAPIATYQGGVAGIPGTRPAAGQRLNLRSAAVRDYRGHLAARRGDVMRRASIAQTKKVYDYATVFNGFAAQLTSAEADKLRRTANS